MSAETFKDVKVVSIKTFLLKNFFHEIDEEGINFSEIDSVEDRSSNVGEEFEMKRIWISFKNGFVLSVIIGEFSYGGDDGLYEIMIMENKNEIKINSEEIKKIFKEPIGYLKIEQVKSYINKIGELK